ncbi:PRTRC system protein A [Methylomonas sp. AM2-LC]|uniref:PRTRC system protein A n=1 Tax=Methylomonas sp. AM2-LC TaxID=3153301 RepID=UPI003267D83A
MSTNHGYLTDTRDQVVMGECPALMNPIFGKLSPPEPYKHRFCVGKDGVYIEAQNSVFEVRLPVAHSKIPLPYGEVKSSGVFLKYGKIPRWIFNTAFDLANKSSPKEWAGLVVWDKEKQEYLLYEPEVISSSEGGISYRTYLPENYLMVMDLHSHGVLDAFFSKTDDRSDISGFYIAGVFGRCHLSEGMKKNQTATRMVVNGNFIDCQDFSCFFKDGT